MFASDADADGDAKVALRIRAGWRHEWRRPPPHIKVHQIVPGPFKKSFPLVEDTPYYFIETKSLRRSRHTRRKRLTQEMVAERRCAGIRTGIPDPLADYLTFRGTPSGITKVSAEDKDLWSERLDLTEAAWKRHGIKLTQGIPNPWESWPRLKGLESGDIECPCLKPKPLEDCPCENPVPVAEEIRREVQKEVGFETKLKKTAKKTPPNVQTRKKSLSPFKFWKKSKRAQQNKVVQPGWYQPLWEFEPQTGKSCGCSEPKPQPAPAKRCECSMAKQLPAPKPSPEKCCVCSEKPRPPPVVKPPPPPPVAAQPSPGKCCGCSKNPKPAPVAKAPPPPPPEVPKPLPEKRCACSQRPPVVMPPPPPVVAKPPPGKCCGCSEKPKPPPVVKPPPLPPVVKPPPPPPVVKPPPPPPVVAKPSPGKCCGCSERPKPPPVVKPQPPPVEESPQMLLTAQYCECSQSQAPPPRAVPIPNPVNYCECSLQREIQKPPPPPRPPPPKGCECQRPMQQPAATELQGVDNYCELTDVKYNLPRVENKPSPGKSCGVTERRNSKQRPAEEALSPVQKVKASRETGYLQTTDSPVKRQEVKKTTDSRSAAVQCDSLECIQGEKFVAKVEPTYLLDETKPSRDLSEQHCPTCKTSCAEKDARKLEELWKDYEKRKETPHSSKAQNEHKIVTEPNLIDIGEDNEEDADESSVPKRRGRLGSILKSGSYEHEQGTSVEAPTKRVSISLPENESVGIFSADQEVVSAPRKKGGRLPHKASSGNISDVSSIARASAAGSVTSDTFLTMMNTASGKSGKSEGVSDEEVELAEVDLTKVDSLSRRVSSENDVGSIIQVKQGSVDTFYLKRPDDGRSGSLETQFALSAENVCPITYANSKFQPNASWPREGSSPSVLSVLQTHMARIEEQHGMDENILQKKRSSEQFEEDGGSAVPEGTIDELHWSRANSSRPPSQESQPTAEPDITHDDGESFPSVSRATKDVEEPGRGLEALGPYPTPTPRSRQSGRSPRRFPHDKSRSSHIVGVPDLEPRTRPRCYACQMQEEGERLKVIENEKESKKRASSARRPTSSGSRKQGEKKRARTPNYWIEKRAKGMAYYADDEAVMIADPQAVKAKVAVIPKKPENTLANSMRSRPRNSSREKEGRNRALLEQEVYKPKQMGKTREYDFLGSTVQGRGSGHGFPGIGMSGSPETSVSDNVIRRSPRTSRAANPSNSSRQDTYLQDVQLQSSQNSSVGKVMSPPVQNQRSRNSKSPNLQNGNSEKDTNPMKKLGYLASGKGPISLPSGSENVALIEISHGYIETQTQRQQQANTCGYSGGATGSSNGCDVCCKPSVYNMVPDRRDSSNNRPVAESSGHRKDKLRHSEKTKDYESERKSLGPPPSQRKGYTQLDPCDDECMTTTCTDRESKRQRPKRSGHKKEDRNRVLSEQEPVRPKHMGRTREYDCLARSGHHLLQSTLHKSEGSCTSCCKSPDCFDPKHGHEGKSMSARRSSDSCDFCCKTSECVSSNESRHLSKTSRHEMLSQQESVRPKHMGKTREYELLGNAFRTQAPSQNRTPKRQNGSKVPAHCPGPLYESNTFLVDPIKLIQPPSTSGRRRASRASGGSPSDVSCECSSDEGAGSTSSRRRPEEQRRKNVGNIFVSQPRRH